MSNDPHKSYCAGVSITPEERARLKNAAFEVRVSLTCVAMMKAPSILKTIDYLRSLPGDLDTKCAIDTIAKLASRDAGDAAWQWFRDEWYRWDAIRDALRKATRGASNTISTSSSPTRPDMRDQASTSSAPRP